ncbi:hypothetical protein [Streptomyces sp. NBC_01803]|uniref:hypothetical protein n=1 Tax=Streptomyces sp. NBC_01803 TaxID=2975946 RepID=UPI002DD91C47|nr:hypothetical protein [Streptomyces sp. NBC_01803]WSA47335.1 hypothetical protein OIE51_26080 [Streptomyces sp. NBC_01803]
MSTGLRATWGALRARGAALGGRLEDRARALATRIDPSQREDRLITRLRLDLAALGIRRPVPGRVRVALRRRRSLQIAARATLAASLVNLVLLAVLAVVLVFFVDTRDYVEELVTFLKDPDRASAEDDPELSPPRAVLALWGAGAVGVALLSPWAVVAGLTELPPTPSLFKDARRYALVMEIAHTISACARAHEAGGERFAERVKAVGLRVNALAVGLRGAHRARGTVPRRSHRHGALRAHERQVIGALRKAEGMLDTDPRQGLRELAEMLLTMAERYAEGRTGALLDADRLTGIDPVPDRTVLRMISAGVLVTAAAVSVTFLGLPGAAEPYAITGLGLVVFTVVFGRQARRAFDILDAIRGGPPGP